MNARPYLAFIFVIYIFITTFFVMNLFVSVIVDQFNEEIKRKAGSNEFSEEQKQWVKMQNIMLHLKTKTLPPKKPINKFRRFCFVVVMST